MDDRAFAIEAIFPNFHSEVWVSYTMKSVLEGMSAGGIRVGATVLAKGANVRASYVHPVFGRHLYRLIGPLVRNPSQWTFRGARRRLGRGDVAYFWLESPVPLCEEFRARGVMVVREMINCTLQLRRQELRRAYAALGLPDRSGISDAMIEEERQQLLAADAVYCPNPQVLSSVLDYGVPADRCMPASYGWSAARLGTPGPAHDRAEGFTVAFVGTADVRKGVPVLLEAWDRAGIAGRVLIAGAVSAEVQEACGRFLQRPDVVQLGFVEDVGAVYRAADVFCFPTWEEGGPLVTLEAMAMGVVPVVTPMGTSGAFSDADGVGLVVPPGDAGALSAALRRLAQDAALLARMKAAALQRAAAYEWSNVGRLRLERLVEVRRRWLHGSPLR